MRELKFPILFGLQFSIVGLFVGVWISSTTSNKDYSYFYIYSTIAGFITAWILAHFLIEKKKNYSLERLIIVAVSTGLISHWLCWYIIILKYNFSFWILGDHYFNETPPANPILAIFGALVFALWSLIFYGWITISGGIMTILTSYLIQKKNLKSTLPNNG